jgi:AbrB family transcriptional regulator, transcriptional pleiotropic regulator of transition state genes
MYNAAYLRHIIVKQLGEKDIMKSTGIVRDIDQLGRVVIPIELRRTMGISISDPLEVFVEDDYIILKKYQPACQFCNNSSDMIEYKGKKICKDCLKDFKQISD